MKLSFYYIQQSIFRETSIIPSYKKNPLELSLPRCTCLPFVLQCVVWHFVYLFQTWANPSKAQLCLCAVRHSSGQCWSDEISFSSAVVGKCKSKREDQSSCGLLLWLKSECFCSFYSCTHFIFPCLVTAEEQRQCSAQMYAKELVWQRERLQSISRPIQLWMDEEHPSHSNHTKH